MPSGIGISSNAAAAGPPAARFLRLDLLEDDIRQLHAPLPALGAANGERLLVLRRQLHVLVVRTARVVRRTRRERLIEFSAPKTPRRRAARQGRPRRHRPRRILLVDGGHERPAKRRGRRWALAVVVARLHLLQLLPRLQQNLVGHGVGHERILGLPLALFRAAFPAPARRSRSHPKGGRASPSCRLCPCTAW